MPSPKPNIGLRNAARSPGSIQNEQHHDITAVQRSGNGVIGAIDHILSASSTKTPIEDNQPLWVVNTTASVAFIFIGKDSDCPSGAPDITNGMAIPPNTGIMIFADRSDDDLQSIVVKTSANTVQVVVLKH